MLRKAEALSILEAVLYALQRRQSGAAVAAIAFAGGGGVDVGRVTGEQGGRGSRVHQRGIFNSMEVVVGRGNNSAKGISRLRPTVARYLASKGFHSEAVGGERGEGVVVVSLTGS